MRVAHPNDRSQSIEHDRVAEFERWAREHGCTLQPAFDRRESGSLVDQGATEQIIRLPLLCLGVYEGSTIRAVYPHVDGNPVLVILFLGMWTDEPINRWLRSYYPTTSM
jgi:hypothetical protein